MGSAPTGPCTALEADVEAEVELELEVELAEEEDEAAVVGPSVSRGGVG